MLRFIRALIYGASAAVAATLIVDWLDQKGHLPSKSPAIGTRSRRDASIDDLSDEARKALLDELAAQV